MIAQLPIPVARQAIVQQQQRLWKGEPIQRRWTGCHRLSKTAVACTESFTALIAHVEPQGAPVYASGTIEVTARRLPSGKLKIDWTDSL